MISSILAFVCSYLIGCLPTGKIIAAYSGVDIEAHGSGNVGATNVARVGGKRAGVFTLVGDILKGILAVWLIRLFAIEMTPVAVAAVGVVAGHCFAIPGRLRGGKGVATALGVILAISPLSAAVVVATFGMIFAMSRRVSMGSIAAAVMAPLSTVFSDLPLPFLHAFGVIALLVIARHKTNIDRIVRGQEPEFSFRKEDPHK